jgi:hypothetical protein
MIANLAFIGLSQVRESAVFSGIPITERLTPEQRTCGVCVVDLRRGETVALLKFTSGVQEVFAVALARLEGQIAISTVLRRLPENFGRICRWKQTYIHLFSGLLTSFTSRMVGIEVGVSDFARTS